MCFLKIFSPMHPYTSIPNLPRKCYCGQNFFFLTKKNNVHGDEMGQFCGGGVDGEAKTSSIQLFWDYSPLRHVRTE